MPKHKKGHDKDKYYHLAKEIGYRSRAAFKLIQINKRFDFLTKARVCIDLCAAPGGWCQVAAKCMPQGSLILGIDLLPIKAIRNVKTIVSDITTAECRKIVSQELQGWKADVVLCDGAPNIGAAYSKDAFVQNELVLAALKTATDHLVAGGTFCTKVYRSIDYNALIWVFQQLFEDVQAMKPNSSRSQSSEIFIVCLNYLNPKYIDPKMLDPNHVFKEVKDPGLQKVDVLHKKYEKLNQRHRTGYDEELGMLLTAKANISAFITSKDPVRMLTDTNKFVWTKECEEAYGSKEHTSQEMRLCLDDLKVLGKVDFKKILKWRQLMRKITHLDVSEYASEAGSIKSSRSNRGKGPMTDEEIAQELEAFKLQASQLKRKETKKKRLEASKLRARQALGMDANAMAMDEDEELFSLSKSTTVADVDALNDVNLEDMEWQNEEDEVAEAQRKYKNNKGVIVYEKEELDDELETDYIRYITGKKGKEMLRNTEEDRSHTAKKLRKSKTSASHLAAMNDDDEALLDTAEALGNSGKVKSDLASYVKLLNGKKEGDDDDSSDDDGNEDDVQFVKLDKVAGNSSNQWFSNSIFDGDDASSDDDKEVNLTMPLTDKQKRSEKRKKEKERAQRKLDRKAARQTEEEEMVGFEIVNGTEVMSRNKKSLNRDENDMELSEVDINRRKMIKDGMGKSLDTNAPANSSKIEIVKNDYEDVDDLMERKDPRTYDSDSEDYDNHDKAMTLALGTLMLQKSRQKALVDASYNRFAWNDPKDLPAWFLDDESKHNKPQLPIPAALLEQIKNNYQVTGTIEIKKVAEARLRKRKRAANKLKAAKKQANMLADNNEMSERQKLKSISKAIKGTKIDKPGKVYVVTRKTGGASVGTSKGGKGRLKFVDKRMKKDRKAEKRAAKKKGKKSK